MEVPGRSPPLTCILNEILSLRPSDFPIPVPGGVSARLFAKGPIDPRDHRGGHRDQGQILPGKSAYK